MKVIFAREPLEDIKGKSVFLAGPTPRSVEVESWRKEALDLFEKKSLDITVFVPEDRSGVWDESIDFEAQIEWEEAALRKADCILFWIPRNLTTMPAFTTNIEFGAWKESGKVVLGYPPEAVKMSYLEYYARKLHIPTGSNMSDVGDLVCDKLGY